MLIAQLLKPIISPGKIAIFFRYFSCKHLRVAIASEFGMFVNRDSTSSETKIMSLGILIISLFISVIFYKWLYIYI